MARGGTGTKRQRTTKVDTLKHKDKRVNIPTEELRDFVADDEKAPKTVLYPRDPSLDPQLVWNGKDEQDAKELEVPAVPIYIQEKIHPQAIIEDLRHAAANGGSEPQIQMFADFNGIQFETLIDFYHHEQNWSNRMILGDSLLVMTSLAEKEGLKGKVQMIYIDPPYGIKFGSNWQVSTRKRDVKDGRAEDVNREPEVVKAFRDTWEKGIHSYLAYLRDRLRVAQELLAESGSIFVQIGDENAHLVRCLLDEVFGSENFVSEISFRKTGGAPSDYLGNVADHLVWYAKKKPVLKYRQLYRERVEGDAIPTAFSLAERPDGTSVRLTGEQPSPDCRPYQSVSLEAAGWRSGDLSQPYRYQDTEFKPREGAHWKTPNLGIDRLAKAGRLLISGSTLRYKMFLDDFPVTPLSNLWTDVMGAAGLIYVVQTAAKVIERCVLMTTDPGDLVLDPTCGSGTTAYVAEQWGRRWITTDTSRVALALARTRLMSSRFPFYLLADSADGAKKLSEITGVVPSDARIEGDVRRGFVYRRVLHATLKSIAYNQEIDAVHTKWQKELEPLRTDLNKLLKQKWEEWQVPLQPEHGWPEKLKELHEQWRRLRRERRQEISASIARHADTELLFDQPHEDTSRVRVTGPFTVESLSPHRVIAADDRAGTDGARQPASEREASADASSRFVQTIIENLKKAGVQNSEKQSRLKFERLEPYAGVYINAAGAYGKGSKTKRVAVCIGPEFGTVGADLIKEAAKEAVRGIGFDLLIVCGFAFDPHVGEEAKRYGKLPILVTRMNPDLAMGDELLKKTGAGNLFMVFGEPDVDIKQQKDGQLVVKVKGVDVYDPTTGQIRNSSTDDIACWFIDTDYNGESFFVRHAYFTGADDPYEKLKRALRAEIDETAWSLLYSTVSRPFPKPKPNGKHAPQIAVKVINHYGDEVMKVYTV